MVVRSIAGPLSCGCRKKNHDDTEHIHLLRNNKKKKKSQNELHITHWKLKLYLYQLASVFLSTRPYLSSKPAYCEYCVHTCADGGQRPSFRMVFRAMFSFRGYRSYSKIEEQHKLIYHESQHAYTFNCTIKPWKMVLAISRRSQRTANSGNTLRPAVDRGRPFAQSSEK